MSEWMDIEPDFCPWTGKVCGHASKCLDEGLEAGYCSNVLEIINRKPAKDEIKMCKCWKTCLLSIIKDCGGTWEESECRGCRKMPVFVKKKDPLVIPEETISGWLDTLGGN